MGVNPSFVGIDLSREAVPDATTLLKFRRLLEQHALTAQLFQGINAHLAERGLLLREIGRCRKADSDG